jgi:hypothetical protein
MVEQGVGDAGDPAELTLDRSESRLEPEPSRADLLQGRLQKVEPTAPFVAFLQAEEDRVDVHRAQGPRGRRGMKVSIRWRSIRDGPPGHR